MLNPRVSVGVPVYNGEKFLEEALISLMSQTYADLEILISDNASVDRTEDICRDFALTDRRIRYYRSTINRGAAWNFNRVRELSTGEYFKWSAHDDICAQQYLERGVEVLDREPLVVLCYGRTKIIDEYGKPVREYSDGFHLCSGKPHQRFSDFFQAGGLTNAPHGLMRANVLKKVRKYGDFPSSDRILLAELALRGQFHEIPEYLFFRRDHVQSSGRANTTVKEYTAWLNPEAKGNVELLRWRWFLEYLRSIRNVELDWRERILCYGQMAKYFRWHWKEVCPEAIRALRMK